MSSTNDLLQMIIDGDLPEEDLKFDSTTNDLLYLLAKKVPSIDSQ